MRTSKPITATLLILAALSLAGRVEAQTDPKACKTSRKCRATIAKSSAKAINSATKLLDKCHAKRDKGKFSGDCNTLNVQALFGKTGKSINKKCKSTDPVRANYTGGDPVAALGQRFDAALEDSAQSLQGSPSLSGDKKLAKCHAAIGKARSAIVRVVVSGSKACQLHADTSSCDLGAISGSCVSSGGTAIEPLRKKIASACSGITGDQVGSCSPLPDCVIDSALATGERLVRQMFGAIGECGNGVTEQDEQCDDGNTINGDGCSNQCTIAICGDKIIQDGETCDDGNIFDDDDCADCQIARCGDGVLKSDEQCDDGNDVADDGCTGCHIDPVSCDPARGYRITLNIDYDTSAVDLNFVQFDLAYPVGVSLPGSAQDPSVQQRLVPLGPSGDVIIAANDKDTNTDGTDDTVTVGYGSVADDPGTTGDGLRPGDQLDVLFDCASGARFSGDNLTCTVTNANDIFSAPIGDVRCTIRVSSASR